MKNIGKQKIIDTFDILDKCNCGSVACFVYDNGDWWIECLECANITKKYKKQFESIIEWNKSQRNIEIN